MTSVLLFSGSLASAASFKDVQEEHWAKDEIDFLVDQNILDDHNKMFHPNKTITKAQAAIILANALDLKTNNKKLKFKDVSKKHYAYKDILAVVNAGIFPNEKSFKPNEPLTRKEVADILVKAYKLQDLGNIEFKDVPKSSKWYEAITRLAENGIISGESDGSFKPNKKVTRAEFAIYIARAMNDDFYQLNTISQ